MFRMIHKVVCLSLLFCCSCALGDSPKVRTLSPLTCTANQEYEQAGLYFGTLPKEHPHSKREKFTRAMKAAGIRAIRFPGGNSAMSFLADNPVIARKVKHVSVRPGAPNQKPTSIWAFLEYCREQDIEPIYQANTLMYTDGTTVYRLLEKEEKNRFHRPYVKFDPSKRDEAAAFIGSLAQKAIGRGLRIRYWELGNEEYAVMSDAKDYADIAYRYWKAIRAVDKDAMIWFTLGENGTSNKDSRYHKWAITLLKQLQKHKNLRKDKHLGFTLHYVWPSVLEVPTKLVRKYGFRPQFAVTEFHMAGTGPYWDLSPRFGYALDLAKYLIAMSTDPRIEILCIHDLTSQNFGIIHYNQRSYGHPGMKTWDPKLGYVLMPSAHVYGLFSKLTEGTYTSKDIGPNYLAVTQNGERLIFLVNDDVNPKEYRWGPAFVGKQSRRYECTSITPADKSKKDPRRVDQTTFIQQSGEIGPNGLTLTLPSFSVSLCRCYK